MIGIFFLELYELKSWVGEGETEQGNIPSSGDVLAFDYVDPHFMSSFF